MSEALSPVVVTLAGRTEIAKIIGGLSADKFLVVALGSGSTTPVDTDTTLETEITTNGMARKTGVASVASYTLSVAAVWSSITGTPPTWREAGLFSVTGNIMLARGLLVTPFVPAPGSFLPVTFSVPINAP